MKRYVLTKDKTIYDTTKMPTIDFSKNANVDKSSDNLLDLAEVGDMLEHKDFPNEYFSITNEWKVTKLEGVTAIWKRNGDVMRRYSVE